MPAHWDKAEEINVLGTKKVISACCSVGIPALVYTSTFNVVFGGNPITNGDETLPYFPLHRHVDHYSRTKSIAEQLVLMADNKQTSSGQSLRTCALRLAGVIGPKERRHLPRIVALLPLFTARFGYGENLVQFAGIDNIVQAHVKAGVGIIEKPKVLGGQAYFISDGEPINHWEYFRPLIEKLGYTYPQRKVPMSLIWFLTYFVQFLHAVLHPIWDFCPVIAPAEVYKSAVTHYFSNSKATRDFDYRPENPNDISQVCEYYCAKQLRKADSANSLLTSVYDNNLLKLSMLFFVGFLFLYFVCM